MPHSVHQKGSDCTECPLKEFSPGNIDVFGQKKVLGDLIKCLGALTVKIIRLTERAKFAEWSVEHTEILEKEGSSPFTITNTGLVCSVEKRTNTDGIEQSYSCDESISNRSTKEDNEWYQLVILTSCSAVSNQHMTDSIRIVFSSNEEKTWNLNGESCKFAEWPKGICQLHCDIGSSSFPKLGPELYSHFVNFQKLLSNPSSLTSKNSEDVFSFTVFHPPGSEKHVSFSFSSEKDFFPSSGGSGRMKKTSKGRALWPSVWKHPEVHYNVPISAGSNGAAVISLMKSKGIIISIHQMTDQSQDVCPMVQFPSGSEGKGLIKVPEVHMALACNVCNKNQGHEKFVYIEELQLKHLPENHRLEFFYQYIHHVAALTVKVTVGTSSRKRPRTHPCTGGPYFSSENKLQMHNNNSIGTGFVVKIEENSRNGQACQCKDCESSKGTESARYKCYQIWIMTATHVSFDQAEANNSIGIEFCYPEYKTKDIATKLSAGKCKHHYINEDACLLEYSTYNEKLVSELRERLEQFEKGRSNQSTNEEHDGFVFIVSHPHGTSKQHVTFGNMLSETNRLSLQKEDTAGDISQERSGEVTNSPAFHFYRPFEKIALWIGGSFKPIVIKQFPEVYYTAETCPGSSGALVCVHKPGHGNVVYTHNGTIGECNKSGGGTLFLSHRNKTFPS